MLFDLQDLPRLRASASRSALLAEVADENDLEHLAQLAPDLAVREVKPLLARIARANGALALINHSSLELVQKREPYVALREGGSTNSYALQLFAWPPHSTTLIHDHSCWGAFCAVTGALVETRYVRLDDESQANRAHIRTHWRRAWQRDHGVSTLLPYAGGIHRVSNPSDTYVFSVHLYGPPQAVDGRDYDPLHDYVCDRLLGD